MVVAAETMEMTRTTSMMLRSERGCGGGKWLAEAMAERMSDCLEGIEPCKYKGKERGINSKGWVGIRSLDD
jgi:hypothetical protein